jgi:UDP-N-acetylmuramoyl-tripeptide--D-alanyl-D-alanine ligase
MNTVGLVLCALAAVGWVSLEARVCLVAARMLQIEEYENRRFVAWAFDARWWAHRAALGAGAVSLVALVVALLAPAHALVAVAAGWLAGAAVAHASWRWTAVKRPLAFTARMRRLLLATSVLVAAIATAVALLSVGAAPIGGALVVLLSLCSAALSTLFLVAANIALQPVEGQVRNHYLRRARQRLAALDPTVVAVAGSYGKTSTKHIIAALLGEGVLPTRKSFNTLMGVTRVVNEDLSSQHRLFIVEMDAYAPGEIAAMCDLVHPSFSVITSVGPQHLERFGTLSRIEDALFECVAALPRQGVAVVHVGDPGGAALARRAAAEGRQVVRYAFEGEADAVDVIVADVRITGRGTAFRWRWPARGLELEVAVPLLGRNQALNVSAALAVVHVLGRSLDAALGAAARLEPVEHRLQPMSTGGALTVIDDSYNANPVGVHDGLDVLSAVEGGAKILVTPGLVELGGVQEEENRRYGRHAAAVCDQVIVAEAPTAAALLAGLREGGLAPERIHTVRDLAETTALLGRLAKPGDVVLFANDLPDTYLRGPGLRTAVTTAKAGT